MYTIQQTDYTHTHPFNGPFSGTTQVSRYQKRKTNLDFTEARDSEWQWHQLDHMQVCTSLQTDNHTSTRPLCLYRPDALPVAQPTASKHWRHNKLISNTKIIYPAGNGRSSKSAAVGTPEAAAAAATDKCTRLYNRWATARMANRG